MGILINNFQKGMSSSPYVSDGAVANSVNLDPFTYPGVTRLNYKTVIGVRNSGTFAALPMWMVIDPGDFDDYYSIDQLGTVSSSIASAPAAWQDVTRGNDTNGNSPSSGVGNGLVVWKNFLVCVGNTTMDFYGLANSGSFLGVWKNKRVLTLTNSVPWHTAFVSRNDGALYIADGNLLHQIQEVVGQTFDPTNSATYTVDSVSLTLPTFYQIRCLEERGNYLLCGTYQGQGSGTQIAIQNATIFPWDRTSTSWNTPYYFPEFGIRAMKTIAGVCYAIIGSQGKLYTVSESGYQYLDKLPSDNQLLNTSTKSIEVLPGAIGMFKGFLCFGIGSDSTNESATVPLYGLYTWGGKFNLEQIVSTGETQSAISQIGSVLPLSMTNILIGWGQKYLNNLSYGVDEITNQSLKYTAQTGYLESLFYDVGTIKNPTSFNVDIEFSKVLTSGDSLVIKYRTTTNGTYTTLATISFTNNGAITAWNFNFKDRLQKVQFRLEFGGNTELFNFKATTQ